MGKEIVPNYLPKPNSNSNNSKFYFQPFLFLVITSHYALTLSSIYFGFHFQNLWILNTQNLYLINYNHKYYSIFTSLSNYYSTTSFWCLAFYCWSTIINFKAIYPLLFPSSIESSIVDVLTYSTNFYAKHGFGCWINWMGLACYYTYTCTMVNSFF